MLPIPEQTVSGNKRGFAEIEEGSTPSHFGMEPVSAYNSFCSYSFIIARTHANNVQTQAAEATMDAKRQRMNNATNANIAKNRQQSTTGLPKRATAGRKATCATPKIPRSPVRTRGAAASRNTSVLTRLEAAEILVCLSMQAYLHTREAPEIAAARILVSLAKQASTRPRAAPEVTAAQAPRGPPPPSVSNLGANNNKNASPYIPQTYDAFYESDDEPIQRTSRPKRPISKIIAPSNDVQHDAPAQQKGSVTPLPQVKGRIRIRVPPKQCFLETPKTPRKRQSGRDVDFEKLPEVTGSPSLQRAKTAMEIPETPMATRKKYGSQSEVPQAPGNGGRKEPKQAVARRRSSIEYAEYIQGILDADGPDMAP